MADVACFCGRLFSFDGAAAACTTCGAVASVAAGPAPENPGHRNRPEHPVPAMNGAGPDRHTREARPGRAQAHAQFQRPAGVSAGGPLQQLITIGPITGDAAFAAIGGHRPRPHRPARHQRRADPGPDVRGHVQRLDHRSQD